VDPAGLEDAVRGARAMGFAGFSCTIPHKVAVVPLLDELAESARLMGAVNCVVRKGDRHIRENTDGKEFLPSLRRLVEPRGLRFVMFGARVRLAQSAWSWPLRGAAQIIVVNRDPAIDPDPAVCRSGDPNWFVFSRRTGSA
jgi:shikimate dehydrogenase